MRINRPSGEDSSHSLYVIPEDAVGGCDVLGLQQEAEFPGVAHFECTYTFQAVEIPTQIWIRVVIDSSQDPDQGVIHLYLSKSNFWPDLALFFSISAHWCSGRALMSAMS